MKNWQNLCDEATELFQLGAWELDLERRTIHWSDITRNILEIPTGFEPEAEPMLRFYKEGASRNLITQVVDEAIESGGSWDLELQVVTATGNEKWVRTTGRAALKDGICTSVFGCLQDIDARKKSELELQSSVKLLKDYMFALDESSIIAITDAKGVITSVNDNFCKISKYSREELIGKTHLVINSRYHPKEFFKDLWRTISSGNTWRGEIKNKTKRMT